MHSHYQDAKNPEILRHNDRRDRFRKELVMPLIETQMLYAGYRLAEVLNTIFK